VNSSKLRVLLDTTYLLPILGVRVKGVERVIIKLKKLHLSGAAELYCSPYSFLEALGKISKNRFDEKRVEEGLTSILKSNVFTEALPTTYGYIEALKLKTKGFRDLIDLLLYSTALTRGLRLLTEDHELKQFVRRLGGNTSLFLGEEEI